MEFLSNVKKHEVKSQVKGDDIIDLGAMSLCAFVACPCNACKEVKAASNYTSSYEGGHGAVRDILEHMIGQKLV